MIELNQENKVSIDDLAIMIAKGFSGVDKKISGLENRFDSLENRFDSLETRFDSLENRVNLMDNRLSNQLDNVVINYTMREEHSKLETRVRKLEFAIA
jgi:predicted nuclease with TOPRIM domain